MKRVRWQEMRDVCLLLGCVTSRTKGDHLIMTRPGMARPVVIKMDRELGEDIIRTNMQTLGVKRAEFESYLATVRRQRNRKR